MGCRPPKCSVTPMIPSSPLIVFHSLVLASCILSPEIPAQNIQGLAFIENKGQWEEKILFCALRGDSQVRIYHDGFELCQGDVEPLRLIFENSSREASIHGDQLRPAYFNYLRGKPKDWISKARSWSGIIFHEIYPGVHIWLRMKNGLLEYDLHVDSPQALDQVRIRCQGADSLRISSDGSIWIDTQGSPLRQPIPKTWIQRSNGETELVYCHYRILDDQCFSFASPDWDGSGKLVIDPGMEWSTFLGGSDLDLVFDIITDSSGEIIVTGDTKSQDFPSASGTLKGESDAYVSKYSSDGSLLWSTYLGGSEYEDGKILEYGQGGSILVAGITGSPDFPVTAGTFDTTWNNGEGYVAQLSADGATIEWASFLGGSLGDEIWAMKADSSGDIILAGQTESSDFPTTAGAFDTSYNGSPWDLFITRVNGNGTSIIWSTFVGGSDHDGIRDMALDPAGNVFLGGWTASSDFPTTPGAYSQNYLGGGAHNQDAILFKLGANGAFLHWSTFFAGTDDDEILALKLTGLGEVAVCGWTSSPDLPTTIGAFDNSFNGDKDAFLATFANNGSSLSYGSFFGGTGLDEAQSMAISSTDAICFGGNTDSSDMPTVLGAYDMVYNGGGADIFIAAINPAINGSNGLEYATFLGGSTGLESALSLEFHTNENAIIGGFTTSNNFHVSPNASQSNHGGMVDGFLTALSLDPSPVLAQTPLQRGQFADLTLDHLVTGEVAWFTYSLAGVGNGPPPPQLGGLFMDLLPPIEIAGQAIAGMNGIATLSVFIPANAPLLTVNTQAVVVRGNLGANSAKSNPLVAPILP